MCTNSSKLNGVKQQYNANYLCRHDWILRVDFHHVQTVNHGLALVISPVFQIGQQILHNLLQTRGDFSFFLHHVLELLLHPSDCVNTPHENTSTAE